MPASLPAQSIELPASQPVAQGNTTIIQSSKISNFSKPLYPASKRGHALTWYMAADVLALAVGWACTASVAVIDKSGTLLALGGPDYAGQYTLIAAAVLLWFHFAGHYRVSMPFWTEVRRIVAVVGLAAAADAVLQLATSQEVSPWWLMPGWGIAATAMIVFRDLLRDTLRKKGRFQLRTLLVGAGETARQTADALRSDPNLHYDITAQVADLPKALLQAGHSWETLCNMHGVEYVIVALDGDQINAARQQLEQLARESIPYSVSPPLIYLPVSGMTPHYLMNHDVMLLTRSDGLGQSVPCFIKRLFDIAVSASALLVLSPLMLGLALWVKRDGGPAFYSHTRVGRNKRRFSCLKFRSMVMNGNAVLEKHLEENPQAKQEWEETRKLVNDPRVTRVGKFLRSTSLDELPQLINVLFGEMSLVGPRPIVNAEIARYEQDIADYYRVRPGVTGLWQVSGRSDVSYPRRVHMDSWYVRNWSLWHDIAILCKTIPALINRTGAY